MQQVIEFGARNLDSVVDCILASVGHPICIEVSSPESGGPVYRKVDEDLKAVVDSLRVGALNSMLLRFQTPIVRYALVTAPGFLGQRLSVWMGTVEITGANWKDIWHVLLSNQELGFVCIGMEEGIELSDEVLGPDSFPWNIPPAIVSAVRRDDGTWLIRQNSDEPNLRLAPI